MYKPILTSLICVMLLSIAPLLHADKYAGEIFYMTPGVSHLAMGNTGVTDQSSLSAAWWNPALLAVPGMQGIVGMHAEEFEGLMQLNQLSYVWGGEKTSSGSPYRLQNRMGLVITHIGIDDIALTKLENDTLTISPTNRPFTWKKSSNNDLMAYFGVGISNRPNLFFGITPKLAYRNMAENTAYGFGADLGMLWMITPDLKLGTVLKDFVTTQLIWQNGTTEKSLPSLHPEISYQLSVSPKHIPVQLALGAEILSESRKAAASLDMGPFSADLHAGLGISPIPELKLMTGYDADAFTAGVSLMLKHLMLEYAIKPGSQDDLGYSQRVAAGWKW